MSLHFSTRDTPRRRLHHWKIDHLPDTPLAFVRLCIGNYKGWYSSILLLQCIAVVSAACLRLLAGDAVGIREQYHIPGVTYLQEQRLHAAARNIQQVFHRQAMVLQGSRGEDARRVTASRVEPVNAHRPLP